MSAFGLASSWTLSLTRATTVTSSCRVKSICYIPRTSKINTKQAAKYPNSSSFLIYITNSSMTQHFG